ncbi:hypothetical protein [Lutimaribacter saemankumensis]|uniref:VPLPA-CTERM protein sorting domain-containing protein n=1 Tax=Lutimaribacter saemankumensis TaxID=490829 RepID=A0A1G8NM65_9RHOB|nr:hypothetical protein [Lutimaribacter saemankumensis]SDI81283.1 VPLPA-CTERM protein sorting domain-containing protein [Lutimaribacter saemankumensis]
MIDAKSILTAAVLLVGSASVGLAASYKLAFTADDYVFDWDLNENTTGVDTVSILGEIVTDGTLGTLAVSNILSWSFQYEDRNGTVSFSSVGDVDPNAITGIGFYNSSLVATEATLSFQDEVLFFERCESEDCRTFFNGFFFITKQPGGTFDIFGGDGHYANRSVISGIETGLQFQEVNVKPGVIASAPIPLPAGLLLLISSLGFIGVINRKRQSIL